MSSLYCVKRERVTRLSNKDKYRKSRANLFGNDKSEYGYVLPTKEELIAWKDEMVLISENELTSVYAIPESLYLDTRDKKDYDKYRAKNLALKTLKDVFDGYDVNSATEYFDANINYGYSKELLSNYHGITTKEEDFKLQKAMEYRAEVMGISVEEVRITDIVNGGYPLFKGSLKVVGFENYMALEVDTLTGIPLKVKRVKDSSIANNLSYQKNMVESDIDFKQLSNALVRLNSYAGGGSPKTPDIVDKFGYAFDIDGVNGEYMNKFTYACINGLILPPTTVSNSGNGIHTSYGLKEPISIGKAMYGACDKEWKNRGSIFNLSEILSFLLYAVSTTPFILRDGDEPTKYLNIHQGMRSPGSKTKSGLPVMSICLDKYYSVDELIDYALSQIKRLNRVYLKYIETGESLSDIYFTTEFIEDDYTPFKDKKEFLDIYDNLVKVGLIDKSYKRVSTYHLEDLLFECNKRKLRFNSYKFMLDDLNRVPDKDRNYDIPKNIIENHKLYKKRGKNINKSKTAKTKRGFAPHDPKRYHSLYDRIKTDMEFNGMNFEGNRANLSRDLLKVGKRCDLKKEDIIEDIKKLLPLFNEDANSPFTLRDIINIAKDWNSKDFVLCSDELINIHLGADENNLWMGPRNRKRLKKEREGLPRNARGKGKLKRKDAVENDKKIESLILVSKDLTDLAKKAGFSRQTACNRYKNDENFMNIHAKKRAEKIIKGIAKDENFKYLKNDKKQAFLMDLIKKDVLGDKPEFIDEVLMNVVFLTIVKINKFSNMKNRETPERGWLFNLLRYNDGNVIPYSDVIGNYLDAIISKYKSDTEQVLYMENIRANIDNMHRYSNIMYGIFKEFEDLDEEKTNTSELLNYAVKGLYAVSIDKEARKFVKLSKKGFNEIKYLIVPKETLDLVTTTIKQRAMWNKPMYDFDSIFAKEVWESIKDFCPLK